MKVKSMMSSLQVSSDLIGKPVKIRHGPATVSGSTLVEPLAYEPGRKRVGDEHKSGNLPEETQSLRVKG
jgi:hypothetical protein